MHAAVPTDAGMVVRTDQREDVPAIVAACVAGGATVFAVDPRDPNLEDLYFAIEARSSLAPAPVPAGMVR